MRKIFLFDVDGTITPSRKPIDNLFSIKLLQVAADHDVYVVTGSDRPKTLEQIGDLLYNIKGAFHCNGNDVWINNSHVHTNPWTISPEAKKWLERQLKFTKYHTLTGNHIEERPGMVNFSVVGRNANDSERKEYYLYDGFTNERETIATAFNKFFPELNAQVAGETGIDIQPKGADKSQIIHYIDHKDNEVHFFGDKMDPGGNDYPLAVALNKIGGYNHKVKDWNHTWSILIGIL